MLTIPSPHWHPCSDALDELVERVRNAVALPVRIELRDAYDAACTELTVRRPVARTLCAAVARWLVRTARCVRTS